jgi:hypothetical protein
VIARASVLLCLGAVLASCITPSIPIPPPDPAQMMFDIAPDLGQARFSYPASGEYASATVYVLNLRTGTGVIDTARDDGSVGPTLPFPAMVGDAVTVSFSRESQTASTCIVIRQGRQSAGDLCR